MIRCRDFGGILVKLHILCELPPLFGMSQIFSGKKRRYYDVS